ncbi:hypothetical protein VSU19_22400 [Verrucomicrobiales bacterium BCK34]|nr:hypothetical protein [Verrucomicrobiales bacterium BCK34]
MMMSSDGVKFEVEQVAEQHQNKEDGERHSLADSQCGQEKDEQDGQTTAQ